MMIGPRWYKVLNDLWRNRTRSVLIVLSIAVGLFAVGTILSSRTILATEMARSYAAINPSSGSVRTVEPFDEDFVQSVRAMRDVKDADARRVIDVRLQLGPEQWGDLRIYAISDYDEIRVNRVRPQSGAWPPPKREVLIERSAMEMVKAQVGDTILIEMPDRKRRELRVAGTVHDQALLPASIENMPYGYISFDTLKWLGESYGFNELYVVTGDQGDKEQVQRIVNRVKDKVEKNGYTIPLSMTSEPGEVPLDDILQAILLLLGALGLLSLFLSVFLIVNTISALLAQQRRQIGVMKAIGARNGQLIAMYVAMVTTYGLSALIVAVPLSVIGARELSRFMASMFNFDLTGMDTPPQAVILQIAVGLLVPVAASLYPLISNVRVTAAEAMSKYGTGRGARWDYLDRLLSGANLWFARQIALRPVLLSMRNTFRSKGRLALTLVTLTLGGAIFVSVFSVQSSLMRTLDDLLLWWNFDTLIAFERPYRLGEIEREVLQVPGATQVDVWLQMSVRRVRPDKSESASIYFYAPNAESALVPSPVMVEGRWLLPEDDNALVVSSVLLKKEPDIHLGDEVVLKVKGRERAFRVVGVCLGISPMAYANYPYVARITGSVGRAGAALVATERHDEEGVIESTTALEDQLKRSGMRVSGEQIAASERSSREASFGILVSLLLIMAVLLALVGGLGLMGTMSINVLERTREIGVLRAIGASNRGVAWVFIREGVAIGGLSWLFGCLLSLPLSRLLSDALGEPLLGVSLVYSFSMTGVWLWLVVVVSLSALASFLPARSASLLTVREVLAYE